MTPLLKPGIRQHLESARHHPAQQRLCWVNRAVGDELMRLLDSVEASVARDVLTTTTLCLARSEIVLGQPLRALDRIETMLFEAGL